MNIRFMSLAVALTTFVAYAADMSSDQPVSPSLPATSSIIGALPKAPRPMVILSKEYMTPAHAAAYIAWPNQAMTFLGEGECSMIIQTDIKYPNNDVFNLLTIPQQIVNGMPDEINNSNCEAALTGMIVQLNRQLITQGSSTGQLVPTINQRVLALAIALSTNDTTYRAQAKWDGTSDQLIPFISRDHIHKDRVPVALRVDSITGTPIAERALSGL